MGFLGDLKNKLTGGAATVTVRIGSVKRGQPAAVEVQAVAKAKAKVSGVYLIVRAVELCQVRDSDWDGNRHTTETVRGRRVSYENKMTIAGAQELENGQTYTWQAMLELPSSTNPSFNGTIIDHKWEIIAGIDMAGNDPDSGWQSLTVS